MVATGVGYSYNIIAYSSGDDRGNYMGLFCNALKRVIWPVAWYPPTSIVLSYTHLIHSTKPSVRLPDKSRITFRAYFHTSQICETIIGRPPSIGMTLSGNLKKVPTRNQAFRDASHAMPILLKPFESMTHFLRRTPIAPVGMGSWAPPAT